MKKFKWLEFITNAVILTFLGYVLYFGFKMLYYVWTA